MDRVLPSCQPPENRLKYFNKRILPAVNLPNLPLARLLMMLRLKMRSAQQLLVQGLVPWLEHSRMVAVVLGLGLQSVPLVVP